MQVKFSGLTDRKYFGNLWERFHLELQTHPPQKARKGGAPKKRALTGTSRGLSRRVSGVALVLSVVIALPCFAQDWIRTGTGLGMDKVRLAASDFKPSTQDANNAALQKTFNETLWNDLDNAGIFEMVSKSFYPLE